MPKTTAPALIVTEVSRQIVYDGRTLADVNPEASVEDVLAVHALSFPELATAIVEGPELKEGQRVYTVKKRLGTKG